MKIITIMISVVLLLLMLLVASCTDSQSSNSTNVIEITGGNFCKSDWNSTVKVVGKVTSGKYSGLCHMRSETIDYYIDPNGNGYSTENIDGRLVERTVERLKR